ncbi:MICAL-like protein 2 [Oopsacas minuta]|uniref:MICAL-like protein 2 n=1 Tax=Oopsacas minuta TaxID=111878 RepID=A0AAV7JYR5_9METZ|nr:MICAL-like protein 2 [Oopsacas minuta]
MSEEGTLLEEMSEAELKKLLETASDYQERSQIRSALRKLKKSRGEDPATSKNANYTRRGHQIEPTTFKLDQPVYYGHIGTASSNRRKEPQLTVPKPKHFIPGMMSPMAKRKDSEDMLSSDGGKSSLSTVHSYAERTASYDITNSREKETAVRAHSYGFDQQMNMRNSPDLGYPESPLQSSSGIEMPSYSSEHTEGSDDHLQENGISNLQAVSPQLQPEQDITLTESQVESSTEPESSIEPVSSLEPAFNSIDSSHHTDASSKNTHRISKKADGELDQLTQQLAYSDNPEEQVQLRKKIRETRELAGRGRMHKHTSFIQIDVKKGSSANKTESGSSSPTYTPRHLTVDEVNEISDIPVNNGEIHTSVYSQEPDVSPTALSSSPLHLDLDSNEIISNEYSSSDELEGAHVSNQELHPYTDLTQLANDRPTIGRTGKRPTIKDDGNIDFTNVLDKSDKQSNIAKRSPRAPIEQHSFKGVLRKNSPQTILSNSPSNIKKNKEPLQMDFRDVLTKKVPANQHKSKPPPPQIAAKPSRKNSNEILDNEDFEGSLPQQLVYEHEHIHRSPSPEQLPAPSQPKDHMPNSNFNNCQELTPQENLEQEEDKAIRDDEAALAYRRDSLQTSQDSRKRLRALQKQTSLTKLRQSITDEIPSVPSGESIPEEMSRTDPTTQQETKIDTVETSSPIQSPRQSPRQSPPKPIQHNNTGAVQDESKLSSYELRRLERKKKRELSGGRTTDDDQQLQADVQEFLSVRTKKDNSDNSSMRNAKESYLKHTGIKNDPSITSRSPIASPNSHSSRTLNWAKSQTRGYNVEIKDLSHSWRDGLAFCALIHSYIPGEFDFDSLSASNPKQNMELAFQVANDHGVPQLFDPSDLIEMKVPDQRSIMTYLSSIYKELHNK